VRFAEQAPDAVRGGAVAHVVIAVGHAGITAPAVHGRVHLITQRGFRSLCRLYANNPSKPAAASPRDEGPGTAVTVYENSPEISGENEAPGETENIFAGPEPLVKAKPVMVTR
jgi:hypothetical protein